MRLFANSKAGFTFVEALITISILGIFLLLTWSTVQFLIEKSSDQIVRTRAHFLTVEGVEIVKQIRQTAMNRNQRNGFFRSIGNKNGVYQIVGVGDQFDLVANKYEIIEFNEDPYTLYCRQVAIEGAGSNEKLATVTVKWGDESDCATKSQQVAYQIYVGNTAQ